MIWNIVDFPAGVLPFGVESGKNICAYDDEGDAMLKMAKEVVNNTYATMVETLENNL